jgi:2,4-dienoyl-CoA reductase-like NADH-dependent reductase (Old Yellow Enzyme family)
MRLTQVKKLGDVAALRDHLAALGVSIPMDDEVDPSGVLSSAVEIVDGTAPVLRAPNRFAVLPMEGWDGDRSGRPTDLVRRRWERFATSGCGLVWGEATAVRHDGRANPNQLVIDRATADDLAALRHLLPVEQIAGLQLTHSGRYARPDGDPAPRTLYRHPILDDRVGASEGHVLSDGEIDELVGRFVASAVLARQAGFDFVDVKACHGYLGHEFLTAHDRPGRYGGDLEGRTAFLRNVVTGIREAAPDLAVALRLSIYDLVPFVDGPDGTGRPERTGPYRYAFGGDGTGLGIDLTETHALLDIVEELGIGLVSASCGSPYYVPHVQRPAYFPPSDGYGPPEDPLVGVARLIGATAELAARHPRLTLIGSGYTYLQDWLPNVAQAVVAGGGASMVGLGRMVLSYPHLPADVLGGRDLDRRLVCRTFSDCTTAPRHGLVSGCYPLDEFYKSRPERVELAGVKKAARSARR